jgi:hypothetical protein
MVSSGEEPEAGGGTAQIPSPGCPLRSLLISTGDLNSYSKKTWGDASGLLSVRPIGPAPRPPSIANCGWARFIIVPLLLLSKVGPAGWGEIVGYPAL